MRLRLDNVSYRTGWDDGSSGVSSKSHEELIRSRLDDLSYLSGWIEGVANKRASQNRNEEKAREHGRGRSCNAD